MSTTGHGGRRDVEPSGRRGDPDAEVPSDGAVRTEGRPGGEFPALRIGLVGGTVGMLCCVGPTALALIGVLTAGTAYSWGQDLYGGYAWWFRLGGIAVTVGLVVWSLRRRQACTLTGVRSRWRRLALVAGVAAATYGLLYGLTTLAGVLSR